VFTDAIVRDVRQFNYSQLDAHKTRTDLGITVTFDRSKRQCSEIQWGYADWNS